MYETTPYVATYDDSGSNYRKSTPELNHAIGADRWEFAWEVWPGKRTNLVLSYRDIKDMKRALKQLRKPKKESRP